MPYRTVTGRSGEVFVGLRYGRGADNQTVRVCSGRGFNIFTVFQQCSLGKFVQFNAAESAQQEKTFQLWVCALLRTDGSKK